MQIDNSFIPFALPDIGRDEVAAVTETMFSGWLTSGPKVREFESKIEKYLGCKRAVALSNCTAALHLVLEAMNIGEGDEVITTPITFACTVNSIINCGAKPILVDVEPNSINIDYKKIEKEITSKTKAIIPVHFAGAPVALDEINALGKKHSVPIVEDAAHAMGSSYKGKKIGADSYAACFSYYPTKNMTTGEGGSFVSNNPELAERVRRLSIHGMDKDALNRYSSTGSWFYDIKEPGWKYNMTDTQAAMGLVQLEKLDGFNNRRRKIAEFYNSEFKDIKGFSTPSLEYGMDHSWHLYVVRIQDNAKVNRDQFISALKELNIGSSVHFIPIHLHSAFSQLGYSRTDLPESVNYFNEAVSLPLYPKMTDDQVARVVSAVKRILS